MIEILQRGHIQFVSEHEMFFQDTAHGEPGCGFVFPVHEDGRYRKVPGQPDTRARFEQAKTGELDGRPLAPGVLHSYEVKDKVPTIGRCHCGREVMLYGFTNGCDHCGRLFNFAGQELRDPSEWKEW